MIPKTSKMNRWLWFKKQSEDLWPEKWQTDSDRKSWSSWECWRNLKIQMIPTRLSTKWTRTEKKSERFRLRMKNSTNKPCLISKNNSMINGRSLWRSKCLDREDSGSASLWQSMSSAKFQILSRTTMKRTRSRFLRRQNKLKWCRN